MQMLVLSRLIGEEIQIGDEIVVTVNRISGQRVSLGIRAPSHVGVRRTEITHCSHVKSSKKAGDSDKDRGWRS